MSTRKQSDLKSTTALPKEGRNPLKEDFRKFLWVVWRHLNHSPPTKVQMNIAWWLQHGPRRKMVQAFRGVGKTYIYIAYICWRLYCNPDHKIMVVSASKALADDMSKFVKQLINDMPILHHLRPRDDQRNTNVSFDVGPARPSKDPSVKSVGITGQITGSRANEILADDIESLNNSATESARERLSEAVKEFDAVVVPGGTISYLGTPQTVMSMYNRLPDRGYTVRIWPAKVPEDPEVYQGKLAPIIMKMVDEGVEPGTPTDPERFNNEDLFERQLSYGKSGFELQFMLNTALSDGNRFPLKLHDLMVAHLDTRRAPNELVWGMEEGRRVENVHNCGLPGDAYYAPIFRSEDFSPYTGAVMAIDPSGQGADETAFAVVKALNGLLYLTAAGGVPGGYSPEALSRLVSVAKAQEVSEVVVEDNFGGGMFATLLQAALAKAEYKCAVNGIHSSTQKEARIIDTLEPVMNQHRLVVNQSIINEDYESTDADPQKSLFYQLTHLSRDRGSLKHDDRLDALAMAVAHWSETLAQTTDGAAARARTRALLKEVKDFQRTAVSLGAISSGSGEGPRGRGITLFRRLTRGGGVGNPASRSGAGAALNRPPRAR